jgi:4,5-dihydroxyphthalate decarboxylase
MRHAVTAGGGGVMDRIALHLVVKNYDLLGPLACCEVTPNGIDLTLERDTASALNRTLNNSEIPGGELSFSRHLQRLAAGDRSFVGIPFFPARGLHHRCFFVLRESGLRTFRDLAGKRIGTNEWPSTGNTWNRSLLREEGVDLNEIRWWVGSVDGGVSKRPRGTLPTNVRLVEPGRTLSEMLLRREVDALMCPDPPAAFHAPDSPLARLIPDCRRAEQEHYRRSGSFPAGHLIGVRREWYERAPWMLRALYEAFNESKDRWLRNLKKIPEMLPWALNNLEDVQRLMDGDWNVSGIEANERVIRALCEELHAQGFISRPLPWTAVFEEFAAVSARNTSA